MRARLAPFTTDRHTPRKRSIQYAAAFAFGSNQRRGILDRAVKPGDDTGVGAKLVAGLVENARM